MGYEYQGPLVKEVIKNFEQGNRNVCLAAAPNSGKTRMAIRVAEEYKARISNEPVMIFTHGQVLLRDQWKEVFEQPSKLSHSVIESGEKETKLTKDVTLSLPQTLKNRKTAAKIGLLIVDEAHHYFHGAMVQRLIARFRPSHILILTGSPSTFLNDPHWVILGMTVQELLERGVATDPHIELVESSYNIRLHDYMDNMTLKQVKSFEKNETYFTLDEMLKAVVTRLGTISKAGNTWEEALTALRKTMVVCHSQSHAMQVSRYFDDLKIPHAISISNLNDGTKEIKRFKTDPNCRLFVVVNRGIIGFDYPQLHNIIDLSGTLNPNRLFQLMCRLIRKDDVSPEIPKIFLKATNSELAHLTHFVMSFVVALSDKKYYFTFKETAFKATDVPVSKRYMKQVMSVYKRRHSGEKQIKVRFPHLPKVYTMTEIAEISKGAIKTVAFTNFRTVKQRLYSNRKTWTLNEALSEARMYSSRSDFEKNSLGAYAFIRRSGNLSVLQSMFPSENVRWNLELCMRAIGQSKTREELRDNFGGAYNWLFKNAKEVLDSAYPKKLKSWTDIEVLQLAAQCKTRTEFKTRHRRAYSWLARSKKLNILDPILPAARQEIDWTVEMVLDLAKNYTSKSAFREANHGAFKWLKREGKLHLLPFKSKTYRTWTDKTALEAALECQSLNQFQEEYSGAYEYLKRHGLLGRLKGMYPTTQIMWNEKTSINEARHFAKTREGANISAFKRARPGAYSFMQKTGKLELLKKVF